MSAKLYGYWRSSAAYRVRIALNLKGLTAEHVPVDLVENGGEQKSEAFTSKNPAALVPALEIDGETLTESLAQIEYLDERHPEPPLLPGDAADRARIRALALQVAANLHPLNNIGILTFLREGLGVDKDGVMKWYRHWIAERLKGLEGWAVRYAKKGDFLYGATPTLADICLVPQLYNARRFDCPLDAYPRLIEVDRRARALPAFAEAAPENQPDAPSART